MALETGSNIESFGTLLKGFRKSRRLTQQQLADAIGVHRHSIRRWEQGDFLPEYKTLVLELARYLQLADREARQLLEASLTALAPYWSVPFPRNPFFTGREDKLKVIHAVLGTNKIATSPQIYTVQGLGGVGKTQVALEYAYQYALEYTAVFWIRAETKDQVQSSLLRISEVLQLPERTEKDLQRIIIAVQRWLSTHSQWLLIWDNLEDIELLRHFLPPVRQGAILLTTCQQAIGTIAQGLDLPPMKWEEGTLFMFRRAKVLETEEMREPIQQFAMKMPAEYEAASELVTIMGGLPLALDQAGAYIEETGCSFTDYLQRYQQQCVRLLDRRGNPSNDHTQSVVATFLLAMVQVEQRQQTAADILRVCAFLHAEAIPEELLVASSAHSGPTIASLISDLSQFDQTIATLRDFSLVQRYAQTHTLSIHRLVQVVLREQISKQEQAVWLKQVVTTLNAVFPEVTYEAFQACQRLLPHVLTATASITEQAEDRELSKLLQKTADYLYRHAQYEEAEPLYKRSLHILELEQASGPEQLDFASLLNKLANLYREQGKYAQAEPLYKQSLSILEQVSGPEHPNLASPLHDLALLYFRQGKHEEAESLYKQSLYIQEQSSGLEQLDFAAPLSGLALLYFRQGKYEEVEPLYKQALHILEQSLGLEHPDLAPALNGLADLYQEQQKYEQAEPLYKRALSILEQALGPEHPDVANLLSGLADLYSNQRQDRQAEQLYKRALSILKQSLGPEHPHVAYTLNNLADLYQKQGKNEEIEPLYKQALSILEQALGPEHFHVATLLNELADIYAHQRKDEQAELLYERAKHILERYQGQHYPETARNMAGRARLYEMQGKKQQAEPLLQQAYTIFEQYLGQTHSETVKARNGYQNLLKQMR